MEDECEVGGCLPGGDVSLERIIEEVDEDHEENCVEDEGVNFREDVGFPGSREHRYTGA